MARRRPARQWTPREKTNLRNHFKYAPMPIINARIARMEKGLRNVTST